MVSFSHISAVVTYLSYMQRDWAELYYYFYYGQKAESDPVVHANVAVCEYTNDIRIRL